jgi:hypothetical protein
MTAPGLYRHNTAPDAALRARAEAPVVLACPDARPPAYQAAIGLARTGLLDRFLTGFYHRNRALLALGRRLAPARSVRLERLLNRRYDPQIPGARVLPTWSFDVRLVAPGAGWDDGPVHPAVVGGDPAVLVPGRPASWPGLRLPQDGGDLPGVVGRGDTPLDVCAGRRGRADEQPRRAGTAARGDLPQDQWRDGQRVRESIHRACALGSGDVPSTGDQRAGVPDPVLPDFIWTANPPLRSFPPPRLLKRPDGL